MNYQLFDSITMLCCVVLILLVYYFILLYYTTFGTSGFWSMSIPMLFFFEVDRYLMSYSIIYYEKRMVHLFWSYIL